METFSALLAICAGNSPVPGEFPTQRPVTRSFDVFFDLRLNKRLSKQWWGWWVETLSRNYDVIVMRSVFLPARLQHELYMYEITNQFEIYLIYQDIFSIVLSTHLRCLIHKRQRQKHAVSFANWLFYLCLPISVTGVVGHYLLKRCRLTGIEIPIINLRRSDDHLRFIMGIPISIRRCRLSELRPCMQYSVLP